LADPFLPMHYPTSTESDQNANFLNSMVAKIVTDSEKTCTKWMYKYLIYIYIFIYLY